MAVPGFIVYIGVSCLFLMGLLMFKQIAIDPVPSYSNSATNSGAAGYMPTQPPKPSATPEPIKKPVTNLPTAPQTHVVTAVTPSAEDKPQVSNNPSSTPAPTVEANKPSNPPQLNNNTTVVNVN